MGPSEIVLTHKDNVLIYAHGQFHELGFYPARLDGRSGRGDTCIGTYVAMRLTKSPLEAGIGRSSDQPEDGKPRSIQPPHLGGGGFHPRSLQPCIGFLKNKLTSMLRKQPQ